MSNIQVLLIIAGVVIGVLVTLLAGIPYLKKKGINIEDVIKELKNDSTIAKAVADEVKPLLPKPMQGVVDIIEKWAPIAVGNAEQLAHTGDIDKADRGKVAEDVVLNVLKDLNITPTENQLYIIDASIKNAVNALGHDNKSNIKESVGVIRDISDLIPEVKEDTLKTVPANEAKSIVGNNVQADVSTQTLSTEDAQKIQDAMKTVQDIASKSNIQLSK